MNFRQSLRLITVKTFLFNVNFPAICHSLICIITHAHMWQNEDTQTAGDVRSTELSLFTMDGNHQGPPDIILSQYLCVNLIYIALLQTLWFYSTNISQTFSTTLYGLRLLYVTWTIDVVMRISAFLLGILFKLSFRYLLCFYTSLFILGWCLPKCVYHITTMLNFCTTKFAYSLAKVQLLFTVNIFNPPYTIYHSFCSKTKLK